MEKFRIYLQMKDDKEELFQGNRESCANIQQICVIEGDIGDVYLQERKKQEEAYERLIRRYCQ